jgi:heme/copper-type cytochrome/quinol oxidase subunit 3
MVFVSCFWANIHFGLIIDNIWIIRFPPKGLVAIFPYAIPLANVLILLYSSLPLQAAQIWINKGVKPGTLECIAQTIACGALFLISQIKEYTNAYFCITDSTYGSAFYCITGLHGLHVTLGVLAFIYLYNNAIVNRSYRDHHLSFNLWAWYWHLVDLVWICLFFIVYTNTLIYE